MEIALSVGRRATSCRSLLRGGKLLYSRTHHVMQRRCFSSVFSGGESGGSGSNGSGRNIHNNSSIEKIIERMGESLQAPAGPLYGKDIIEDDSDGHNYFIPQVPLHGFDGRRNKRILM